MYIKIKITLQAAAACETFLLFNGKTLLSDVPWIVRPECCMRVPRGRLCNKIAGTVLQNIHRIEPFATCCRYLGYLAAIAIAFNFCRRTALRMTICQCK